MAHQAHNFTLDTATLLEDGDGAITSTTAGQVSSAAAYVDLGAANAYAKFAVVVDWSALTVAGTNNEVYQMIVEGAEATAFSTAFRLATRSLGDKDATGHPYDSPTTGRVVLYGDNVQVASSSDPNSIICPRYIRIRCVVSGSSPSITYKAWFVPLP